MPIWNYKDILPDPELFWKRELCSFCGTVLTHVPIERKPYPSLSQVDVYYCEICGWPMATRYLSEFDSYGDYTSHYMACGSLRNLNLIDQSIPILEIKQYLIANYEARFNIHPRIFEEVVASVFGNLGYKATLTNYSGDDGIDIFLEKNNELIGVQVKRYKKKIQVDQIRSLAGAMILNGVTKGIFVSTSGYQRGVDNTVERFTKRGFPITIYDSDKFYDALMISQRSRSSFIKEYDFQSLIGSMQVIYHHEVPPGN